MVDQQLRKTKKVVKFTSTLSPSEIEVRTLSSGCGGEEKIIGTVVSAGPGTFIPVVSKYKYSVDHGNWPDGSRWIALRTDGMFHGVVAGLKLSPEANGGTDVSVLAADPRKVGTIKQLTEDGTLLCHWGEVNYPYD
jgi:hypothetical protein